MASILDQYEQASGVGDSLNPFLGPDDVEPVSINFSVYFCICIIFWG
jgi:hypothetical protein